PGREPATREHAASRPRPTDGALSLARAFQLMSQALSELRGPVTQEALRLRMAALHGREDALLDPARFPRLLRQANDAEIADVRKVGDDDYEITGSRSAGPTTPAPSVSAASAPAGGSTSDPAETPEVAEPAPEAPAGARENGQRFGVRFRRGSRGSIRAGDIPLIGVVQIEASPAETLPVEAVVLETEGPAEESEPTPAKPKRSPRKKKAAATTAAKADKAAKAEAAGSDADPAPAAPVKRGRSRAKKKAE
ncbi:MAG: hypothetical protein H0X69_00990, partial [Gemmatimonadales bacterium]|nr:hypothetical protein [Gemmatimonadales bacterium]